jgi:hypothetical protein
MRVRHIVICLTVLCFGPLAVAQQVSFQFANAGNNYLGGIQVAPYDININGFATTGLCDDFYDDVYVPSSWTATVVTEANAATDGLFSPSPTGTHPAANPTLAYEEVAWLAQQLYHPGGAVTADAVPGDLDGDISWAIWNIFDPGAANGLPTADYNAVVALTGLAATDAPGGNYSDVTFYVPVAGTCTGCANSAYGQEFVTVPEAPSLANLGFDLTVMLGAVFVVRRNLLRGRLVARAARL